MNSPRPFGPPRRKRRWPWILAGIIASLILLPLVYYHLILDWQGRPFCHKQVRFSLSYWMGDRGSDTNGMENIFPNIGGVGKDSLEVIREEMGGVMDWAQNYKYVPGLREDDPGELILLYFNRPTRWTWHGPPPPTIFKDKKWIVVRVDFGPVLGPGECSERISEADFKRRLRETIEFVRTNERPNWQKIVAEHTAFLDALENQRE